MQLDPSLQGSLFDVPPARVPELDPGCRPLALGVRAYRRALAASGGAVPVVLGLEQGGGCVARRELEVFPAGAGRDADNLRYLAWILNGLLWSRGGCTVRFSGPPGLFEALREDYGPEGRWGFAREIMARAFDQPLRVEAAPAGAIPAPAPSALALGGHLEGCRVGFDLGASDYKMAAVRDGEAVFSAELPWDPRGQADPAYHYARIDEGIRLAASHLPRLDAIGGSSAGILVDSRVKVSSLFRAVPPEAFEEGARDLFLRLGRAWGVPLEVINDGDVTALAGGLSLGARGILGLAMGSSEAAGFLDRSGRITGWLNELAFAVVDAGPDAGTDDWCREPGVGAACFSQQALERLAPRAGFRHPGDMPLPERLRDVQERMAQGDPRAMGIFRTIGTWLGYALAWYEEFYDMDQVMVLGRVTSGPGGEEILARAREVLEAEFPETARRLSLFLPDERARRVGQAVAAASLPALDPGARPWR